MRWLLVPYLLVGVLIASVITAYVHDQDPVSNYRHPSVMRFLGVVMFVLDVVIWPFWALFGIFGWLFARRDA